MNPHFTISEVVLDECKKIAGITPPEFKDVTSISHEEYLKKITMKDALLLCSEEPNPKFPDNLQGECAECGCSIYYRPYNQKATKKVCESCGIKIIEKDKQMVKK